MIGFRVDANENIATGHMMRCIAIAIECRRRGMECIFILAENKETQKLVEYGFSYRILDSKWDDMDGEEDKLIRLIRELKFDWLVIDSYQATASYLASINAVVPVMYIDDMAKEVYSVNAILRYGQWPEDNTYQKEYFSTDVSLLIGMQYVPLREEFRKSNAYEQRENSILITTGGTDTYNVTYKVLCELQNRPEFSDYKFEVIVGSLNQNKEVLQELQKIDKRITLNQNVKNMDEFMRKCRFAVSAGGTTLYELCACGIPTVCFSFADNQQGFTYEMGMHQIMRYAGDAREHTDIGKLIVDELLVFYNDRDKTVQYSQRMKDLVDGRGTRRIVDFFESGMNLS